MKAHTHLNLRNSHHLLQAMFLATLLLAGLPAARAVDVLPGETKNLSGISSAKNPDLAGTSLRDAIIPFEIKDGKGNVLVKGIYQDSVSRSTSKGTVIFGPRVRDLEKPNGDAWITNIVIESFEDFTTDADFRSDGLGVVGAKRVTRSKAPGASLNFGFDVILPPDDSKFLSILTDAPSFALTGKVTIFASNDFGGNSFSTTLNNTAAPVKSSDYVMDGAQTGDKACPGEKIPGTYDYHFEGILVGSPLDFGVYLSVDNNITTADRLLTRVSSTTTTTAGAASGVSFTALLPSDVVPGSYFIGVIIDDLFLVAETDEKNNTSKPQPITILDCRPDLQPGNYSIPASACPGEDIGPDTFLAVVNVGPGDAEGANAGFYLSKDNVLSVDDVLLIGGRDGVPALPAGSSANITAHNNIIPADTAPGSYFIIAVVDEPRTVSETNENNNTSAKSITILDCTPKAFTISGLVTLANQQPLAGVLIALEGGGQNGTRTTDHNGEFKFEGLPEGGTYLLTPSSSGYKFTPTSGTVANLSGDASIGFLADKLERPIVPIKVEGVSSPIVLEFDRAVYRSGDLVRARATFGSVKPTETEIALMIVSPVKDDVEAVIMTRTSDGVYEIASPIEVKSEGAATKLDGIFLAQPGEMFAGLLYIDSIPSMVGRIAIDIVSDLALLLDPGFVGSPVEVNRALALTEDENKIPQGGKPVGTLLKAGSLPVQIALHELIFAPKESGDLNRFLTRANGKVSMEIEGEDGTSTYLVQVTPSADDLACLRQLRSLFDDKDKLYASNDGALETYSMALKYRLEGFIVGVNPRLQFMAVPSPGEPLAGGAVSRSMANDGPLNVPQVWAFLALWDRDRARIPLGVLDMGFAPNPDFRRRLDGTFIECDMEGRSASDILRGFRCAPGIAQGPPTVGASFFGPPVWHGTGVVTVAGGVINNGFGSVGTGGQVVEPMLYRYGLSSYVFEIGSGIRRAVLDGAAVINISAGYPCRIIDTVGIEFSICDPAGRAGFCTAATATLSLAAAAVCSTVGPLAAIPIFGPFLSTAAAVACGVTTVAVVTASAACFATLAAGDLRGPMQSAVDFATERGVPIVTSAGNAFAREGLPPVIRDIIDVSERRTERWDIIPAMIPQTIVAAACQDNWPYTNLHFFGDRVDLWAPISSTYFHPATTSGTWRTDAIVSGSLGGTSAAAPFIAGVIADMMAVNPSLNPLTPGLTAAQRRAIPQAIKDLLTSTAWSVDELVSMAPVDQQPTVRAGGIERRNLINPIRSVRAAARGILPDLAALGYDDSLDFNEISGPTDFPTSRRPLDVGVPITGTIVNIRGEGGAPNRTDVDYFSFVMPNTRPGLFRGTILVTVPRGFDSVVIDTPGFEGPFSGLVTAQEETFSYLTPTVFNGSTVIFRIAGVGGSDSAYKIELDSTAWVAPLPAGDRFDRDVVANPVRPNNDIDTRAVPLGSDSLPWEHTDIGGLVDRWELHFPDLNFHFRGDDDWFSFTVLPPLTRGDSPGCMPEMSIAFGQDTVIDIQSRGRTLARGGSSPFVIPADMLDTSVKFKLYPRDRGPFIRYNLDLTLVQGNQRLCELATTLDEARGFRDIFGTGPFEFPRVRPDEMEFGIDVRDLMGIRMGDDFSRVTTPDGYVVNWTGSGAFQSTVEILIGNSLMVQLRNLDGTVIARAQTADLMGAVAGLQGRAPRDGEEDVARTATVLEINVDNLPKGEYILDISHGTLGTELLVTLPEGAISDGSRSIESTAGSFPVATPNLDVIRSEGETYLIWTVPSGQANLEKAGDLDQWESIERVSGVGSIPLPPENAAYFRIRSVGGGGN